MAKKNCFILVNKNGNMITTDHKLPIYWNKKVALTEKERFKAHDVISIDISSIKNLFKKSATEEYLNSNAKKVKNKIKKEYYFDIYYYRSDGEIYMQTIKTHSYKKAKKVLLGIHKGIKIKISHYERKSE